MISKEAPPSTEGHPYSSKADNSIRKGTPKHWSAGTEVTSLCDALTCLAPTMTCASSLNPDAEAIKTLYVPHPSPGITTW